MKTSKNNNNKNIFPTNLTELSLTVLTNIHTLTNLFSILAGEGFQKVCQQKLTILLN